MHRLCCLRLTVKTLQQPSLCGFISLQLLSVLRVQVQSRQKLSSNQDMCGLASMTEWRGQGIGQKGAMIAMDQGVWASVTVTHSAPYAWLPLVSGMLESEILEGFQWWVMTRSSVWGEAMEVINEVGWRTSSLQARRSRKWVNGVLEGSTMWILKSIIKTELVLEEETANQGLNIIGMKGVS